MKTEAAFQAVLTPRETEILEIVTNGHSAKEVAVRLSIAQRTVERHIENIRLKLQAKNRVHMVKRAIILGELTIGLSNGDSCGTPDAMEASSPSFAGSRGKQPQGRAQSREMARPTSTDMRVGEAP